MDILLKYIFVKIHEVNKKWRKSWGVGLELLLKKKKLKQFTDNSKTSSKKNFMFYLA